MNYPLHVEVWRGDEQEPVAARCELHKSESERSAAAKQIARQLRSGERAHLIDLQPNGDWLNVQTVVKK